MKSERIFAFMEISWLSFLFWLALWGLPATGVGSWNIAASLLFFCTIALSAAWRKPGLKTSGFRTDNLLPALKNIGSLSACVVIFIVLTSDRVGFDFLWTSPARLLQHIGFGIFQQCLMLGYLFHRWTALLRSSLAAAVANSIWFAWIHLPDVALAGVAGAGELCFTWLFLQARNVMVIGTAHGVLSLALLPLMLDSEIMKTSRIGPPELAAFADKVGLVTGDDLRVAVCSKVIVPSQLGQPLSARAVRIMRGKRSDAAIGKLMSEFLSQEATAVCITTEREFYRYLDSVTRERLHIIAQRYMWRNAKNSPHFYERDPVLGIFRDRALLVSNRPLA
jgi:hypothetical protein